MKKQKRNHCPGGTDVPGRWSWGKKTLHCMSGRMERVGNGVGERVMQPHEVVCL